MWRSLRIRSLCGEYHGSFRGTDTGGKKRRRSGTGISGNPRRSGRVHSFAVGSSSAIYIAQCLKLEYAVSAGTIVLLTLLMTKWETVKVSIFRLLAFLVSIVVSWVIFLHIEKIWIAYGLFTFIIVFSRNWQVGGRPYP